MADTADVNQWRGPVEEPYRPRMRIHPGMVIATILGFVFWWPVGLAFLFFTLRRMSMGCWSHQDRWQNKMERMRNHMERRGFGFGGFGPPSSGNRASTNTAWKPSGALRRSRPNSRIFSIGCVTPRTRKSSTCSWRNTAPGRPPRRMASRKAELEACSSVELKVQASG